MNESHILGHFDLELQSGPNSIYVGNKFDLVSEANFTNHTVNVTRGNGDAIILGRESLLNYYMIFDYSNENQS